MSEPTRKLRTKSEAVIEIDGKKFKGPKSKLKIIKNVLSENNFQELEDSTSWRGSFQDILNERGEPGTVLRGMRLREELTQQELAEKLGISQYNLSKMENGKRSIGKEMANRLGRYFRADYRIFL